MSLTLKPELILCTDENIDDYKDPCMEASFELVQIQNEYHKEKEIETNRIKTQSDEHQTFIKTRKYRSSQELQIKPLFQKNEIQDHENSGKIQAKSIMVSYLVKRFLTKLSASRRHRLFFKHKHFQIVGDKASGEEQTLGEIKSIQRSKSKKGKSKNILQLLLSLILECPNFVSTVFKQLPIIYPQDIHKIIWDISFCFVLIYFFVMIPLELAFNKGLLYSQCIWLTVPLCLFLLIDCIMKMSTVYYENGQPIIDKNKIFKNYLKNGLISDGLAILVIIFNFFNYFYVKSYWISLLQLCFVTQFSYFTKITKNVEESINLDKTSTSILNLAKLLLMILYIVHLYSCLWFFIGDYGGQMNWSNWLDDRHLKNESSVSQYLESFYFSTVTMISVGYGDIVPQNELEKVLTILFMLTTCIQLSFTINTVAQIFSSINHATENTSEKIRIINKYMSKKNISFGLQYQIRQYIKIYWSQQMKEENEMEEVLINSLSENLKNKLIEEANSSILDKCEFIKNTFTNQTKSKLIKLLKTVFINPEQTITSQLPQFIEPCLCFIESGELHLQNNSKIDNSELIKFHQGQYFGLNELLTGQLPTLQLQSESFVQLTVLLRSEFLDVLRENPIDYETFCAIKDQILMHDLDVQSKCISCNCSGHTISNCPVVHFVVDREKVIKSHQFYHSQKREQFMRKKRPRHMFHPILDQWFLSEMSNMFRNHGEWPIIQFYSLSNKLLEQQPEKIGAESPIMRARDVTINNSCKSQSQLPNLHDILQISKIEMQQNPYPQNKTMRSNYKRASIRIKNIGIRLKFQKIVKKIIRLRHFSNGFQKKTDAQNQLSPQFVFNKSMYWVVTSYFQQPQLEEYLSKEDFLNLSFLNKRLNLTLNQDLDLNKQFDCAKEYLHYLNQNNLTVVLDQLNERSFMKKKSSFQLQSQTTIILQQILNSQEKRKLYLQTYLIKYLSYPNEYFEKFHKTKKKYYNDEEQLGEKKRELIKRFSNKKSLRRSNNMTDFQRSIQQFHKLNRVLPTDFNIDTP
ncbi:unnamed protein product (macronuclear) [Paramecium tetraurelia]|uniref:Cyclic nucleotide-binding domain-containing protein n=1 Tax=Paramecium tetraurelia TaxID=5888 RepID=A0E7Z6_PARTE|nr:uncharacterized protein GSPATT00024141001 [Paramecium tetraurelia]CAK91413.1 unnamed protein product [Paramecium tetraurelia]|eukprot:XP_001458810.1 hypothetical protein (macronuclear) [Paramecium tetraurelia strain d4-2]